MPKYCPVCGGLVMKRHVSPRLDVPQSLKRFAGSESVAFYCGSSVCAARHRESLYHFVSRAGFDIRGLGWKIIDKFLDEGLIGDAADIFTLHKGDIAALPRFGEKSAENIVREVEEKKRVTLLRFLYALGILHVGEETARALAREIFNSKFSISKPGEILKVFQKMSLENLQTIPDIGPAVSRSIYDWFREPRNTKLLEKFDAAGVQITNYQLPIAAGKLTGKTFVLTGTLSSMSREAVKERIRAAGGEASESVSKKTSYVVAGENPGAKLETARRLGVKILNEKALLSLLS